MRLHSLIFTLIKWGVWMGVVAITSREEVETTDEFFFIIMDPPTLGGEWMEKGGYEPLIAGSLVWEDCVEDNEWEIKVRKCWLFYFFFSPLTLPTPRRAGDSFPVVHVCRLNLHIFVTFHFHLASKSSRALTIPVELFWRFSLLLKKKTFRW